MKFEIFKFDKVTSTNDVAISLIKEKKKKTGYVYSHTQTKGRGRFGRKWISNKGNLFGSIFFPLKKNFPPFNEFATINPIIVSGVIKGFCTDKRVNLKFPNDIFVNGKKICGILQELVTLNGVKFLIIGMGINIITNPRINKKYETTNIFKESKKKPKIKQVINLIIFSYEKFFSNLNSYNYVKFKKKAELMSLNSIG